jgi:acetyl esterase/lipase
MSNPLPPYVKTNGQLMKGNQKGLPMYSFTGGRSQCLARVPAFVQRPLFLLLCCAAAYAGEPKVIPLWPGPAPGSENSTAKEADTGPDDPMRRVSNVTQPTLTAYLPEPDKANGTGIIICPGGGFRILAIDREGNDVARWLNSLGVTAFVLKYRVMQTGDAAEKAQSA